MKISKALAGLMVVMACSPVMAQTALQQLGTQAGVDMAPLMAQMKLTRDIHANGEPLTIPRFPKDVFTACTELDAKPFVAWTTKQAAQMVQSCLDRSYGPSAKTYAVTAKVARFGVKACPDRAGMLSCQAIIEVEGIEITVSGKIMTGNSVLSDLNFSLQKREGKLVGFHAVLDDKAVIVK